ncbi:uncharacterized protein CDV56_100120 [Aspergillus thermomutatus]|uniref:Uncharacterized protein n=1 Tax=Aspergillus thermomutatus TaxID=41047 RepID=A0A397GYR3_ASPTH|nr:uncharacterized protein CDV56_100120 [Aspergillus thermomutatus]RHZ55797.1 hypothetical protein CDV56_100120 [Aspergillus thermomutatus]
METPAEGMPPGWTNDPALLEGFFDYDSGEAYLARCHGLNDPKLLLMTTPDTGDMGYIITSGGRFYWGDLMIDHIAEITKPKTWPAILRALATQGEKGLRMKFLRPVKEVEEEPQEEEIMVEGQGLSVPSRSDVPSTSENLRDIIADITSRPGAYGVPPENVANLVLIHQDITRLRRPDGPDFLIPPPPHDREVHPNWPSALEQVRLRKSTYDGVEYWALPDLLGLFMSSLAWTPTIRARGRNGGRPFGRCAETYPVRKLLMGKTEEEAAKVHGLALWSRYIHITPAYDDRLSGRIWGSLWDPCANCQVLISINKGNILNFGRLTEGAHSVRGDWEPPFVA